MTKLRLTKNSLQQQQQQLKLYRRLLPSLDLKRRQLTIEVQSARGEYEAAQAATDSLDAHLGEQIPMLADASVDLFGLVQMTGYRIGEQNVVGIRLPILEHIEFSITDYSRLATPAWVDTLVRRLKDAAEARVRTRIAKERLEMLDLAVRRITQRVNLFEKILIPTAKRNIQRIRISLGDAERAAVVTSKLAKVKQQAGAWDLAEESV